MYLTDKKHLKQSPNRSGDRSQTRTCCEIPEESKKVSSKDAMLSVVDIVRMVAGDSYWLSRIL